MTFRSRTAAVILATALVASPAAAAGAPLAASGGFFELANEWLLRVAAWFSPGFSGLSVAKVAAAGDDGVGELEGTVWDPDGVCGRGR